MTDFHLPRFFRARRSSAYPSVQRVDLETRAQLDGCGVRFAPNAKVAIGVGSRGIANLRVIVRTLVHWLRDQGAKPFIVPAMGSHGGGTAAGQAAVLESYGITESSVGAPIVASMAVVELDAGDVGVPVYFDKAAWEADATVIVNRIKPHTSFHGPHESGLLKMVAIGLGKHEQAKALHRRGVSGLRDLMPRIAEQSLRKNNVRLAIAVVENCLDQTMVVRAVPAADISRVDRELLCLARQSLPSLPCRELDLLVVDEIGKDISGLGMDTNVIGRLRIPGEPEPESPRIRIIFARELSPGACGNAVGVGLADIVTRRLVDHIDFAAMYENVLTTGFLERGKIPLVAGTDSEALRFAARALGLESLEHVRMIRIRNTLRLDQFWFSEPVHGEVTSLPDVEALGRVDRALDEAGGFTEL